MSKEENLECSFCGRKKPETDLLIAGMDTHCRKFQIISDLRLTPLARRRFSK